MTFEEWAAKISLPETQRRIAEWAWEAAMVEAYLAYSTAAVITEEKRDLERERWKRLLL